MFDPTPLQDYFSSVWNTHFCNLGMLLLLLLCTSVKILAFFFFFCYIFYHSHSLDSWKLQLDILLLVFGLNIRSSSLSFLPISHDINCFTSSTIVFAVHWTHSSLYLSEMLRSPQLDTLHSKVSNVHLLSSAFSESIEQMEKINLPLLLPSIAI